MKSIDDKANREYNKFPSQELKYVGLPGLAALTAGIIMSFTNVNPTHKYNHFLEETSKTYPHIVNVENCKCIDYLAIPAPIIKEERELRKAAEDGKGPSGIMSGGIVLSLLYFALRGHDDKKYKLR
jgi:hypothetical protein